MLGRRVLERRLAAFRRNPLSIRRAVGVIVSAMLISVVVGGVLVRLADPESIPNIADGLWWALQTVTTVGYGDVLPHSVLGRAVAALVMLEAIAFVSIVTAGITSTLVERIRQEREQQLGASAGQPEHVAAQLTDISVRLDRIERALARHSRNEGDI